MANYLPPEKTVYTRAEALRWMRDMGWDQAVIDAALYHDNPTEQRLRDLVYQHGPLKAYEILCQGVDLVSDSARTDRRGIRTPEEESFGGDDEEGASGRGAEPEIPTAPDGFPVYDFGRGAYGTGDFEDVELDSETTVPDGLY